MQITSDWNSPELPKRARRKSFPSGSFSRDPEVLAVKFLGYALMNGETTNKERWRVRLRTRGLGNSGEFHYETPGWLQTLVYGRLRESCRVPNVLESRWLSLPDACWSENVLVMSLCPGWMNFLAASANPTKRLARVLCVNAVKKQACWSCLAIIWQRCLGAILMATSSCTSGAAD